jgi:hypothetical protein
VGGQYHRNIQTRIKGYKFFFFSNERNGMNTLADKSAHILASKVWLSNDMIYVLLQDGRKIGVPLLWFTGLRKASREKLNDWHLIGNGVGIH